MYGMIAKITANASKRTELAEILSAGTRGMPGCLRYVVSEDSQNENILWITEVWDSEASHHASLTLPTVQKTIATTKPLIAGFEKIAVTKPLGGVD
jgi:quinol monooxygenase YgiN